MPQSQVVTALVIGSGLPATGVGRSHPPVIIARSLCGRISFRDQLDQHIVTNAVITDPVHLFMVASHILWNRRKMPCSSVRTCLVGTFCFVVLRLGQSAKGRGYRTWDEIRHRWLVWGRLEAEDQASFAYGTRLSLGRVLVSYDGLRSRFRSWIDDATNGADDRAFIATRTKFPPRVGRNITWVEG